MLVRNYVMRCCPIHDPLVGGAACCCIGVCNVCNCIAVRLLIMLTCVLPRIAVQLVACESGDRNQGVRCLLLPTAVAAAITKALVSKVPPPLFCI